MGEGFGQLVFILLIMAAAAFDAMARNRKKRERMDEMDQEEAEGRGAEGHAGTTATRERPSGPPADEGERRTADQMIPEDFWAILTGQAPAEPEPEPEEETRGQPWEAEGRRQDTQREQEARGREGTAAEEYRGAGSEEYRGAGSEGYRRPDSGARRPTEDPPARPHIPVPVPSDRYAGAESAGPSGAAREQEPAETRRGSRWMEGLGRRDAERVEEDAIRAQEAEVYGALDEPWDQIEDIAAGEIEIEAGITDAIGADEEAAVGTGRRRRARGASPYTRLLETGDREDLRKAIVLKEVLGTPAGFREIGHDWG